jgi:eukaryotic-like serine/threonine-protein kinase
MAPLTAARPAPSTHAAATRRVPAADLPCLLAGFDTLDPVATGGLCEVWKVRERASGRVYALKQLSARWLRDETARQLLLNEAVAGLAVDSPHVVRVLGAELDRDPPLLLLEWLAGASLEHQLECHGRLDVAQAVWIARQCVVALIDLAAAGFSHGDVKPGNILLDPDGVAHLVDLGFARRHGGAARTADRQSLLGTPEYLAPETMLRGHLNPVSLDVYSLGVTLYQMLTGRLPFHDATVAGILRMQRQARPARLERSGVEVPQALSDLVARMLAKQPVRRPACLNSLLRDLLDIELQVMAAWRQDCVPEGTPRVPEGTTRE